MKTKILILALLSASLFLTGCGSSGSGSSVGTAAPAAGAAPGGDGDLSLAPEADTPNISDQLTEEQKYSLAYMWHEEKLAKDIYLALNALHPAQQLENIANRSEVKHIERVQGLVEMYDINITNLADYEINYSAEELNTMPPGVYAVPEIQDLYNTLYEIGSASTQAALEVGCMVEVVDINDLDRFIQTAGSNQNLIDAFVFLRDGSYTHYWSFDNGLKNMGISDGCCSLGVEYCHPEYPGGQDGNGGGGNGRN